MAQISVLKGLGWELHRIWTMDWWDNREKELSKLMELLNEKKKQHIRFIWNSIQMIRLGQTQIPL